MPKRAAPGYGATPGASPPERVAPLLRADDPTVIGQYRVAGRLGAGGMGTVYLAHDRDGRPVAVKVIRGDLAADPEFRARFADEVAAARRVAPFCTAQVLDADPHARRPYLVTEYIDGQRLDEVVTERGPLGLSTLQGVAVGVASALTAIHGAGIVHRDLKPSNVLLSFSGPRVIDFGIARALDGLEGRTRTGLVLGSAGWMAPEQMQGHTVGPPADVFAWAILVAYAATGRHPYGDGSYAELAERILYGRPDISGVPDDLRGIVSQALAQTPTERPTAESVLLALLGDRGRTGNARVAATEVIGGTWPGFSSGFAGAGGAAGAAGVAAAGAGAGGAGRGGYPDPTRAEPPSYGSAGRSERQWPPNGAPRQAAPPPLPPGGRRRGYVQYPEDAAAAAAAARPPAAPRPQQPAPPQHARPQPPPQQQQFRPAPPPPQQARPPAPYAPYREPAPRRRRRFRLRIPFKKTIIFVVLVLLLLSAADQIATMVDDQRQRLWERAVTSVEDFVDRQVDRLQGEVDEVTDQQRENLGEQIGDVTDGIQNEIPAGVPGSVP